MKKVISFWICVLLLLASTVWSLPPTPPYSLPSQTGNSGKYLTTDGSTESWSAVAAQPYDLFLTNIAALTPTTGCILLGGTGDTASCFAMATETGYFLRSLAGGAPTWSKALAPATIGTIDNMTIGATTRAAGSFTTLDFNAVDNATESRRLLGAQPLLVNSAGLAAALSDETGNGTVVFGTGATINNATLTTPILGTPRSGTLTSCTGLPISTGVSGLGANVATWLATSTVANLATVLGTQTANTVFAGPVSGAAANPTMRALVAADIPKPVYQTDNATAVVCGGYYESSVKKVFTTPTMVAGCQICFKNVQAGVNTIYLIPASGVFEKTDDSGLCSASQMMKSSGAVGDRVCYVGDGTNWQHWGSKGTWTCTTP